MSNVNSILSILAATYPEAHCELNFSTPFELLIATMLSAQATDKKVNQVTERLFRDYKTPEQFLTMSLAEMEQAIKELGLYHNKAKNILATCHILVENYGGEVPGSMEALTQLPGVGRKTANVVLSNAFHIPAMAVDTHVLRVSNRLGLASGTNPDLIEKQLMSCIPRSQWIQAHHWLIWHGRRICAARNPKCPECPLSPLCPSRLLPA
ncbi:endonuclease III [Desulfitobacterium chlororespirans]|uniref:Endonuclease III n=1 Tax=Desulfitobacterium chlororespirans DSM 11544 TaxID=1121395 RepID=A0A1M7UH23_9FIRM|nr:endonuclease III [Desulfitobacterium chlororespirans]SHN82244.1 DNA-(apurinic or apyrimidinic site) lyase /endonuclease III [Desulfitobacterium chlororespirans DSM 11544]